MKFQQGSIKALLLCLYDQGRHALLSAEPYASTHKDHRVFFSAALFLQFKEELHTKNLHHHGCKSAITVFSYRSVLLLALHPRVLISRAQSPAAMLITLGVESIH